jgi:hypothetical protein
MKRLTIALIALTFTLGLPIFTLAMSQDDHSGHGQAMVAMNHGSMQHGDMAQNQEMSQDMDGGFVEVGKDTQEGVVATVKVKAYDEKAMATMAKMGMNATHHVMVSFADEKSGAAIAAGKAAVKVKGQDAKPVMLMLMGDGFGGDVTLAGPGMYTFEIGTKLADGNKRQFEVGFHNQ